MIPLQIFDMQIESGSGKNWQDPQNNTMRVQNQLGEEVE